MSGFTSMVRIPLLQLLSFAITVSLLLSMNNVCGFFLSNQNILLQQQASNINFSILFRNKCFTALHFLEDFFFRNPDHDRSIDLFGYLYDNLSLPPLECSNSVGPHLSIIERGPQCFVLILENRDPLVKPIYHTDRERRDCCGY